MTRRLLVVEHECDAGIGQFGERFARAGLEVVVVGPEAGAPLPENLSGFDALVVLGGSMGPTEDEAHPWLPAARRLLGEAVREGLPTLGICLGAQLLTTVIGGRVETMAAGPEVGLHTVRFSEAAASDELFGALAGTVVPVVQWHWLAAESLPPGAILLASSDQCAHQVFRVGPRAWAVQFHPEVLGATTRAWADESETELADLGLDADTLVGQVFDAEGALREVWGGVADRFAALVEV